MKLSAISSNSACGYRSVRIDQKEHSNKIDDEIIAEIRRSRFLVADFTCEKEKVRGGVYYEAGFAMGLPIPVIWTCSKDSIADRLGLANDFLKALRVVRFCLVIRNQYAHWVWWDDYSGKLAFANLEDLAQRKRPVRDLAKLKAHHVDAVLLSAQEAYFVYADDYLAWINYEGRARDGKLKSGNPLPKPTAVKKPKLRL